MGVKVGEGTGENLRGLGRGEIGSSLSRDWMVLMASFTLERFCRVALSGAASWPPESFLDIVEAVAGREGGREGGRKEGREGGREGGREEGKCKVHSLLCLTVIMATLWVPWQPSR